MPQNNSSTHDLALWGEGELDALRLAVAADMSPKRYEHTIAVEEMVAALSALYCPEETLLLRAAALLHDVTKGLSHEEQLNLCRRWEIPLTAEDIHAPKTLHARTAAALIPIRYPAFAHEAVLSAVRWHTTGRRDMTLPEQLLYLADYIDKSRLFPDCVRLRTLFWKADPAAMPMDERLRHLRCVLIQSFDMTIRALVNEGAIVSADTMLARNDLMLRELADV